MENADSLQILRDSTVWFIDQDPTTIVLTRKGAQTTITGASAPTAGVPLAPQKVKLIGRSEDGISEGEGGKDRSYEYTVLLEYTGDIKIGDTWKVGDAFWHVYALEPANGYEIKARARQFSKAPSDG